MSANSKSSNFAIFRFAAIVCLVCSLVVSAAAVSLRSIQEKNALNEMRINILVAAGLAEKGEKLSLAEIDKRYDANIVPVVVDLKSGDIDNSIDANTYDMYAAAQDAQRGTALTEDPASIKRIAHKGSAYLVMDNNEIKRVIIPIQGYGLWSTMYGFTALELDDGQPVVSALTFYKHAETAGLGSEITNPVWQAKWQGKHPYDAGGNPQLKVPKRAASGSDHEVDSISGATLTSKGVEYMMNFWLGEQGYQAFIRQIQEGKISAADVQSARAS